MPLVRRRRPLLRAAAAGGAAYMGKRAADRHRESEGRFTREQPSPPAGGAMTAASTAQLSELAALHDRGVLTDAEFEQQKRALLG